MTKLSELHIEGDPDYQDISDTQLIRLFKDSDGGAFTEIFKRYRSLLLLFTYRRTSDLEKSKELIRDAFIDLWEKRQELQISGALRPFLITLIKSRLQDGINTTRSLGSGKTTLK